MWFELIASALFATTMLGLAGFVLVSQSYYVLDSICRCCGYTTRIQSQAQVDEPHCPRRLNVAVTASGRIIAYHGWY